MFKQLLPFDATSYMFIIRTSVNRLSVVMDTHLDSLALFGCCSVHLSAMLCFTRQANLQQSLQFKVGSFVQQQHVATAFQSNAYRVLEVCLFFTIYVSCT